MSEKGFRVEIPINIKRRTAPEIARESPPRDSEPDDVPQTARLLALAHKWDGMVRRGEVRNYAHLARVHSLSSARVSQICGLVLLPPRVQESLLASRETSPHTRLSYHWSGS